MMIHEPLGGDCNPVGMNLVVLFVEVADEDVMLSAVAEIPAPNVEVAVPEIVVVAVVPM